MQQRSGRGGTPSLTGLERWTEDRRRGPVSGTRKPGVRTRNAESRNEDSGSLPATYADFIVSLLVLFSFMTIRSTLVVKAIDQGFDLGTHGIKFSSPLRLVQRLYSVLKATASTHRLQTRRTPQ